MPNNTHTDPYAGAPIIEIHTETVLDLIAGHIGYEPTEEEFVAVDLARAALLDRLALRHPCDDVAQERAHVAAVALITRLDDSRRYGYDDPDVPATVALPDPADADAARGLVRAMYRAGMT